MIDTIKTKLTELKKLDARYESVKLGKQNSIDDILTDEIIKKLDTVDLEWKSLLEEANENVGLLTDEIKVIVLEHGASVKNDAGYSATFVRGRTSWDTKALNGYAAAHPEIEQFKKTGNPTVRLQKSIK